MSNRKPGRTDYFLISVLLGMFFIILWANDSIIFFETDFRPLLLLIVGGSFISAVITAIIGKIRLRKLMESITSPTTKDELEEITVNTPVYVLVDSVDREILDCLNQIRGDLVKLQDIVLDENILPTNMDLKQRLRKFSILGLIRKSPDFDEVYLTSRGLDVLNTPATLFASNVSAHLWNRVLDYKTALWQGKWSDATRNAYLLLEEVLIDRLKPITMLNEAKWTQIREDNYQGKKLNSLTLGQLIGASRQLDLLKESTLEYWLASELNRMRKKISHTKDGQITSITANDAANVDLFMDVFLQVMYSKTK